MPADQIATGFEAGLDQHIGSLSAPVQDEGFQALRQTAAVDEIGRRWSRAAGGGCPGNTEDRPAGIGAHTHIGAAGSRRFVVKGKERQVLDGDRRVGRAGAPQKMGNQTPVHAKNADVAPIGLGQVAIDHLRHDHPGKPVLLRRGKAQAIGKIIHTGRGYGGPLRNEDRNQKKRPNGAPHRIDPCAKVAAGGAPQVIGWHFRHSPRIEVK